MTKDEDYHSHNALVCRAVAKFEAERIGAAIGDVAVAKVLAPEHPGLLVLLDLLFDAGERELALEILGAYCGQHPVKRDPRLGASLGLGVDWQTPGTYTGVAVRAQGTGALCGAFDPRIDLELAGKIGLRHWHTVRVGAEGIVFVPVHGGGGLGVGAAVTVELER